MPKELWMDPPSEDGTAVLQTRIHALLEFDRILPVAPQLGLLHQACGTGSLVNYACWSGLPYKVKVEVYKGPYLHPSCK